VRATSSAADSFPGPAEAPPVGPEIPDLVRRELRAIIERATAWDPARRQPTVKVLIREIDTYQMGGLLDGLEYDTGERVRKWARAHPLWAGAAATGLVGGLILAVLSYLLQHKTVWLAKRLAQVYAEKAAAARLQHDADRSIHYSALALATWPGEHVLPSSVPYTVLAEHGRRGRHLWSQALSAVSTCVAFGPDGRTVATAGVDGAIDVWDLAGGQRSRTIPAHDKRVLSLAFSRTGLLASGGADGAVRVWDSAGRVRAKLEGHTGPVHSLSISPDGTLIVSASEDGTLRCFRLDGVAPAVPELAMPTVGAGSLALDKGIEKVFVAARDGSLPMRDIAERDPAKVPPGFAERRLVANIRPCSGGIRHVNYIPPERGGERSLVAFSGSSAESCAVVRLWDLTFWRDAGALHHERRITSICLSPNLRTLASASEDGVIRLWDLESRKVKLELTGHRGSVLALAISPDARLLASVGEDASVRLWDVETGWRRIGLPRDDCGPADFAFTPDGRSVLEVQRRDGLATTWSTVLRAPAPADQAARLGALRAPLAQSPDGRRIALRLADRVALWELPGPGRPRLEAGDVTPVTSAVQLVGFTRGGRPMVLERTAAGFRARDLAGARVFSELLWPGASEPVRLAIAPEATRMAAVDRDGAVWHWEPARTGRAPERAGGIERATAIAFSARGNALAVGEAGGDIVLWEPAHSRHVRLEAHHSAVRTLSFSPDGEQLVSTADEPVARLWDLCVWRDVEGLLRQLRFTSPFDHDDAEMTLLPRRALGNLPPWFPPDYRLPEEGRR
jgi:WD40 repeat protein